MHKRVALQIAAAAEKNQCGVAACACQMSRGNDRISAVVAFAGEEQSCPSVALFEESDGFAGDRPAGPLHEFFTRRSSGDSTFVESPDLLGRHGFHRRQCNELLDKSNDQAAEVLKAGAAFMMCSLFN